MRKQTFYGWLEREVASSRMALVGLYESRDRLLYIEAPPLRKKYMEVIGVYEEPVLRAELEVSMLRRKAEMIRIAINRKEPVDLEAIDERLEEEKREQISELEDADKTLNEFPELDGQQTRTLQRQYREITDAFHPAVNPGITETQKELYGKAAEAYKMQDVEAMKLIYDMLFSPADEGALPASSGGRPLPAGQIRDDRGEFAGELYADYYLAKKLYGSFSPLEEDRILLDMLQNYEARRKQVGEEISGIRSGFPFNAQPTLNDRAKTEEYLAELRFRASKCEKEKAELQARIASMTEGKRNG